jgi:hypothetical protein
MKPTEFAGILPSYPLVGLALIKYERSSLWMQEGEQLKPLAQYGYGDIYALQAEKLTVYGDIYEHLKTERQSLMIADVTAELQRQQRPWLSGDRAWIRRGSPPFTKERWTSVWSRTRSSRMRPRDKTFHLQMDARLFSRR